MQDFEIQRYKINQIRLKYLLNYYQASIIIFLETRKRIYEGIGINRNKKKKKEFF